MKGVDGKTQVVDYWFPEICKSDVLRLFFAVKLRPAGENEFPSTRPARALIG
jgi:hypothetical protein